MAMKYNWSPVMSSGDGIVVANLSPEATSCSSPICRQVYLLGDGLFRRPLVASSSFKMGDERASTWGLATKDLATTK